MPRLDKHETRRQAHAARKSQSDKAAISSQILARAMALPEYQAAERVLFYVDARDEVRTRDALQEALRSAKQIAIPYCVGAQLGLCWLHDWSQLAPGRFGVLEPKTDLREQHEAHPAEIDLVLAPGVAFDRQGNRMGHGKGFYDRLLAQMPRSTNLIGLAFDCQIFAGLETHPHDIPMDQVVTQSQLYVGEGRFES